MDFYYFYSCFLSFVDYLKKNFLLVVLSFLSIFLACLYFYIIYSFELKSSESFMKFINGNSSEFLEKKQYGVYEEIRKILIDKEIKSKENLTKMARKNDVLSKHLKFVKQMDGEFGDDFDSILEAEGSAFRNLFISSKVFYGKDFNNMENVPFFLSVFMQCKKGVLR